MPSIYDIAHELHQSNVSYIFIKTLQYIAGEQFSIKASKWREPSMSPRRLNRKYIERNVH